MKKKFIIFFVLLVLSLAVSGCSSDEETSTTTIEGEDGDEYDVTYTEGDVSDEDCPVGSIMTTSNPNTGEMVAMEIVGKENIDGIEMCHGVYEANTPDENGIARVEYYWSNENDEAFMWIAYDEEGNVISEMKAMDGKITITSEDGEVIEMDMTQYE